MGGVVQSINKFQIKNEAEVSTTKGRQVSLCFATISKFSCNENLLKYENG